MEAVDSSVTWDTDIEFDMGLAYLFNNISSLLIGRTISNSNIIKRVLYENSIINNHSRDNIVG
jgi:hypothetical protein